MVTTPAHYHPYTITVTRKGDGYVHPETFVVVALTVPNARKVAAQYIGTGWEVTPRQVRKGWVITATPTPTTCPACECTISYRVQHHLRTCKQLDNYTG